MIEDGKKTRIFISYSRKDIVFARHLCTLLKEKGLAVWIDEAEIQPGDDWEEELRDNITACSAFVVIMSPDSEKSDWVQREFLLAEKLEKPIFPVLLAGNVWFRLAEKQFEDMTKGLDAILSNEFITAIHEIDEEENAMDSTPEESNNPPPSRNSKPPAVDRNGETQKGFGKLTINQRIAIVAILVPALCAFLELGPETLLREYTCNTLGWFCSPAPSPVIVPDDTPTPRIEPEIILTPNETTTPSATQVPREAIPWSSCDADADGCSDDLCCQSSDCDNYPPQIDPTGNCCDPVSGICTTAEPPETSADSANDKTDRAPIQDTVEISVAINNQDGENLTIYIEASGELWLHDLNFATSLARNNPIYLRDFSRFEDTLQHAPVSTPFCFFIGNDLGKMPDTCRGNIPKLTDDLDTDKNIWNVDGEAKPLYFFNGDVLLSSQPCLSLSICTFDY